MDEYAAAFRPDEEPGAEGWRPVTCNRRQGPIWKLGGETCQCVLPAGHDGWHRCNCGGEWVDVR